MVTYKGSSAYKQGRADEKAEWEAIGLGEIKKLVDELQSTRTMLEANQKEVTRLNEAISRLANEKTDALHKLGLAEAALRDLRANPPKADPDSRTDRVVQAIHDATREASGDSRRLEAALEHIRLKLAIVGERL
jgi:hypothetical protein